MKSLGRLSTNHIALLSRLVQNKEDILVENDIYENQVGVQKLINRQRRKRLAAYFTKASGLQLMAQTVADAVNKRGVPVRLADPFLGSGLTVTETLKHLDSSLVKRVWGVEPHPLSALVAYSAILYYLRGDRSKISVRVGDVFENVRRDLLTNSNSRKTKTGMNSHLVDVLVTNPPFTRWELLEPDYRDLLRDTVDLLGYSKYLTRQQLNLQLVSLFLMDYLLDRNGLMVSVLPASTFYTIYGEAAKSMLLEKYRLNAFIEGTIETSFSAYSGFKEIILVATKAGSASGNETTFITMKADGQSPIRLTEELVSQCASSNDGVNWIDLTTRSALWEQNWLAFFGKKGLRELLTKILSKAMELGTVGFWKDILGKNSIMRGVEMYGPDFFFVPNRYWNIIQETGETVAVQSSEDGVDLEIPREYLVPALRRPKLYFETMSPRVSHYLLCIPPDFAGRPPNDLVKYMDWGKRSQTALPAINALGDKWYSHVHKQINVKKPFGRVFLPDKIDPSFRNRGVFACYSRAPLSASKDFHIASLNDQLKDKALTTWFNSTLFIAYFVIGSRRISKNWTRLLIEDYLKMPIINVNSLERETLLALGESVDHFSEVKLPPVKSQLGSDYRRGIDMTLLEAMGEIESEDIMNSLQSSLEPELG
jgi:hypothetical protein